MFRVPLLLAPATIVFVPESEYVQNEHERTCETENDSFAPFETSMVAEWDAREVCTPDGETEMSAAGRIRICDPLFRKAMTAEPVFCGHQPDTLKSATSNASPKCITCRLIVLF